jgi:hypothetical protein
MPAAASKVAHGRSSTPAAGDSASPLEENIDILGLFPNSEGEKLLNSSSCNSTDTKIDRLPVCSLHRNAPQDTQEQNTGATTYQ